MIDKYNLTGHNYIYLEFLKKLKSQTISQVHPTIVSTVSNSILNRQSHPSI